MTITLGSLFDGIGVFPLAASRHGITPVWASEIKFGDEIRMRNISGLEAIPDSAFKYKCCACHKTGSYCIKVRARKRREA